MKCSRNGDESGICARLIGDLLKEVLRFKYLGSSVEKTELLLNEGNLE